jgi:sensor histidine kinase regulating citrate/malate metabolism
MNVFIKSVVCMAVLLLFVISLLFTLSFFKFQTILTDLIANRLSATSPTIYESIESAIDLGLGLREIQNTERVILWVQPNNPGIQSIDIFSNKGHILYSTDKPRTGLPVDPQILQNVITSTEHKSQMASEASFLSTFKLLNNYNQTVGGGLITYSKDSYQSQVAEFKNSLLLKAIIILIAFSILASIGISIGFRGLNRYLKSIETSHDKIRQSDETGQNVCFIDTNHLPAGAAEYALIRLDAFDERLCEIEKNITDANRAIDALELPETEHGSGADIAMTDAHHDQQPELASKMARPLILVMMVALFLSSVIFAYISFVEFNRFLEPELKKKAQLIALNIEQDLTRAVEFGIPFEELVGVGEYLDSTVTEFDEVTYLEVQNTAAKSLYRSGQTQKNAINSKSPQHSSSIENQSHNTSARSKSINYRYPININNQIIGHINVGIDEDFIRSQLDSIFYDNIVIFVIAVLVAYQIMTALFLYYVTGPIERLNMLINLQVKGNFSKYMKTRGGDAVGKVARYLSQSAIKLNARFKQRRDQLTRLSEDAPL